ncbi:MAG TPA: DNA repair protein RecN [Anaerolineaceae bacterium]|nr:DNA repair protein RecN [Anaerolineaceae bacterium]
MLTELHIENFAIIQQLELTFGPGLITFTGETGAGKSIILDAIIALVGGHAEPTLIRAGSDRAMVEATFELPANTRTAILDILKREDLLDDPNHLMFSREIRREGRSVGRVNGRSINLSLLRELGSYLIDIHGQSEHLSLLNVRQHIGLLDRYAGSEKLISAYRQSYQELQSIRHELNSLRQMELDSNRRAELLGFQAEEIESAHLLADEEGELRKERDRLANAENLSALAQQSLLALEEGTLEIPAISEQFGQVLQSLTALSRIDASMAALTEQAENLAESLSDISRELRDYLEKIEYNPRRLEQVEERLDLLHALKRKYGGSIAAVLAYAVDARQKLETIAHAGERIEELEIQEKALLERLALQGLQLSNKRKASADTLGQGVETELAELNMSGARFKVDIHYEPKSDGLQLEDGQKVAFDESGLDHVEFLIAPNPGEGFKPLVKIASGGETSRLMLALKNVLARVDYVPTLIFDEIDQGIGGRTGLVVGEKLWKLARQHQVFCVTHLPQLAAFGDQHFRVQKQVRDGRTTTQASKLDESNRLDELAEMLGNLTDANRDAARATLDLARARASQLVKENK